MTILLIVVGFFLAFCLVATVIAEKLDNWINATHAPAYDPEQILTFVVYHGSPDLANIIRIAFDGMAFVIGRKAAYGLGFYCTTVLREAMHYAGKSGGILQMTLTLKAKEIEYYDTIYNSQHFQQWCKLEDTSRTSKSLSKYCLNVLEVKYIRHGSIICCLTERATDENERAHINALDVNAALDAKGNEIARRQ